ncbi:TPA: Vacuolar H+transporting two-sector ATPase F subunit [bacterium]|jgi:V/A-type H+-transporting ATPase subunit F|nr:Vacuolar H+transporting two-sector ATPase F subunit [bacterium]
MKFILIGDEHTVLGYSLIGIQGVVVKTAQEALDALSSASKDPEIGVILITQRIASLIQYEVNNARLAMSIPVVLEIPDRQGPLEGRESAMNIIQRLIGIKV